MFIKGLWTSESPAGERQLGGREGAGRRGEGGQGSRPGQRGI